MGYVLGVDLGTTWTAAAVHRDDTARVVELGNRSAAIPSVVLVREDEGVLVGEAASTRAVTEPERVAREFKRRLGDPTPLLLGGRPYSAEQLQSKLLRSVVARVAEREGSMPDRVAITHPANWGPYKLDLLHQAVRMADLVDPILLTEPQAAAVHYASQSRIEPGTLVGVYDLGGGTFDAAVLRKTDQGFDFLGQPEGIERLGGIDFDEAVFAHVSRALGGAIEDLDPDDSASMAALARLRADCVLAKEALSGDTEATIPVVLPNVTTEVRITRAEFESLIRPTLSDTIDAMHRAIGSAGVPAEDLHAVLLVGGSSRIPLVAQLVGAELGRPVAVDAHPKYGVALGAALSAMAAGPSEAAAAVPIPAPDPEPETEPDPDPVVEPPPAEEPAEVVVPAAAADAAPAPAPTKAMPAASSPAALGGDRRGPVLIGGGVLLALVVVLVVVLGGGGGDGGDGVAVDPLATASDTSESPSASPSESDPTPASSEPTTEPTTAAPVDPDSAEARGIPDGALYVTLTSISIEGGQYLVEYETEGFEPLISGDNHLHFWWQDANASTADTAATMGVSSDPRGSWQVWPNEVRYDFTSANYTPAKVPFGTTMICASVATNDHQVEDPSTVDVTHHCIDLP